MLGNRNDTRKSTVDVQDSLQISSEAPLIRAHPTQASSVAVIGPKIRFSGELVGEEDLIVQGSVEGTIDLKGHNLTIGEHGTIKANLIAKTITIKGNVEGDIFGQERIAITSSSKVKGNLTAERVILEDGAKFRGSIDMDTKTKVQESKPAASTYKNDYKAKANKITPTYDEAESPKTSPVEP